MTDSRVGRLRGGSSMDVKEKWTVVMQDGKYVVLPDRNGEVENKGLEYNQSRRVVNVSCILHSRSRYPVIKFENTSIPSGPRT